MSCPICGASCRCRKRGADGMCCSCHRHKVRRILVSAPDIMDEGRRTSYLQHLDWQAATMKRDEELADRRKAEQRAPEEQTT